MRHRLRLLIGSFGLLAVLGAALPAVDAWRAQARTARRAAPPRVLDLPVSFRVRNTNTSQVPCSVDGARYTVRGHLVGPRGKLLGRRRRALTVYLHGLGLDQAYWRFRAVRGYDYATSLARLGHVSLVYDRVGYGRGAAPDGNFSCYGGDADVAHQIVGDLRSGHYRVAHRAGVRRAPRFRRIALAGTQFSGFDVSAEAYSYHDVDAVVLTSFADQGQRPAAFQGLLATQSTCLRGGQRQRGGSGPRHYAFVGSSSQFDTGFFTDASRAVLAAANRDRVRDPCGQTASAPQNSVVDNLRDRSIAAPVLLVYGDRDALFNQPSAGQQQRALFAGSRDVTLDFVRGAGNSLALEREAPRFRAIVSRWLRRRGF